MKVIFLLYKATNDLFAFFPTDIADNQGNFTSYSHVGQHSACSIEYAQQAKEATPKQYADLLQELKGQGYDDLEIVKKAELFS